MRTSTASSVRGSRGRFWESSSGATYMAGIVVVHRLLGCWVTGLLSRDRATQQPSNSATGDKHRLPRASRLSEVIVDPQADPLRQRHERRHLAAEDVDQIPAANDAVLASDGARIRG